VTALELAQLFGSLYCDERTIGGGQWDLSHSIFLSKLDEAMYISDEIPVVDVP
jgi:hypothetical protein